MTSIMVHKLYNFIFVAQIVLILLKKSKCATVANKVVGKERIKYWIKDFLKIHFITI